MEEEETLDDESFDNDDLDKDGEHDHTKVVRESERRHANNARERYVIHLFNCIFVLIQFAYKLERVIQAYKKQMRSVMYVEVYY